MRRVMWSKVAVIIACIAVWFALAVLLMRWADPDGSSSPRGERFVPVATQQHGLFFPECAHEDSVNCVWHARRHGNRRGRSFIVTYFHKPGHRGTTVWHYFNGGWGVKVGRP